MSAAALPAAARWMGYGGLLPFAAGALLAWLLGRPEDLDAHAQVMRALSLYAALIVSFLAGIHWTAAMFKPEAAPGGWVRGVVFMLLAWLAALMPAYAGLVVQGVLLLALYALDRRHYPPWGLGSWLLLRFRCSVGASLLCFLAAAAT
jgi:Protein of unknown function (DUF3429)